MKRHKPLTKEQILDVLDVDIETGICVWKNVSKFHKEKNGKEAGTVQAGGARGNRCNIMIGKVPYRRYRLIFMVAYGWWPDLIDHIDGDSLNDRASNLRPATSLENARNHKPHRKTLDLPPGVRLTPKGRFTARLGYDRKMLTIGTFDTKDEASLAYKSKRLELFGEYCPSHREVA